MSIFALLTNFYTYLIEIKVSWRINQRNLEDCRNAMFPSDRYRLALPGPTRSRLLNFAVDRMLRAF